MTRWRIAKRCLYRMECISLLPGIIIVPKDDGFILQFKFLRLHAGVQFTQGDDHVSSETNARCSVRG